MTKTLLEVATTRDHGGVLNKPRSYFDVYDFHFEKIKNNETCLFEIGVGDAGSTWMWKKYFTNSKIYALDNRPECLSFSGEDVNIHVGFQESPSTLTKIHEEAGGFDIVIDDGGHTMEQQLTAFETLFPLLNYGGIYVVEDLHTSYWDAWGGSKDRTENTMINRLTNLINNLNFWAIGCKSRTNGKRRVEHNFQGHIMTYYDSTISSVHFHPSICFVYKKTHEKYKKDLQYFKEKPDLEEIKL